MKRWGLAVGCDNDKFNDAQRECLKYNVFIRLTSDIPEALVELYKEHNYLLAANPGRVITQEQLYQQILGYDYVPMENSLWNLEKPG